MSAPDMVEQRSDPGRPLSLSIKSIVRWGLISVIAVAMLYLVWGLYLSGEPLFAIVVMAICLGIVTIFGSNRFYTARFVFPAITAILVFIALPVVYTSYVGFTNFGARNLLTFDRVTAQLLAQRDIDKSTERPFSLVQTEAGYQIFLPEGAGGLLSQPFALDGTPQSVDVSQIEKAPDQTLAMRDVIKLRGALQVLEVILPDGTGLSSSGLRSFASIQPVYMRQDTGALQNQIDGTLLTPDQSQGFYVTKDGKTIAPGWRVGVGFENFKRVLFSDGIRQPMVQIFIWTVTFAFLSMVFTFSLGILLALILQWEHLRFRNVYRVLLILPYAVPAFISILVFRGLFNQNFGEINLILEVLFGARPLWFTDPNLARAMTLIVNTWLGYPYIMLIGMGYLQSVPVEHYKAAALEGAGPIKTFFSITLPQILPPIVPLLISNFAFNFNNVVLILLLMRGLPDIPGTQIPAGQTDLLGSFTFRISFMDAGQNFGLAGAIATLTFIIVAGIAYANLVAMRAFARKKGVGR